MKRPLFPLLLLPALAWAEADYPLEGGTRTFVGGDIVNTFAESGTLVVHEATTVRALFVAGGGGGGTGVGGGGGGSGFGYHATGLGGYGGCGTVIVAYDLPSPGMLILIK